MFGWSAAHIPLLVSLPALLVASAFFSGSETALFGLSQHEREELSRSGSLASKAVDALLAQPRMLLITVLLGNMVVNVLYFVINSVLLLAASETTWLTQLLLATSSLMLIVLLGEVLPKTGANSARIAFALVIAPPLLLVHRALGPLRIALNKLVIEPLSRLTAGETRPPALDQTELAELLEVSGEEGVIDETERRVLHDVIALGDRRVSDAMTPRVRTKALPLSAVRQDVMNLARETKLTKLPVYDGDLDHIAGILHVKRFLLDPKADRVAGSSAVTPARFVPELATLDHVLEDFRTSRTQLAVAVDEYGGTAGVIAVEDIVREVVGELRERAEMKSGAILPLGEGVWRVDGEVDLREFEGVAGSQVRFEVTGSIEGVMTRMLGRAPTVGDTARAGKYTIEIETMEEHRVCTAIIRLEPDEPDQMGEPS